VNSRPTISVIMPTYNSALFLSESIKSILNQTFEDFEFIIIDDGSTDDSKDILNSFEDPRIFLYTNVTNKGIVDSLNFGISVAKGKYVVRMDSDDISKRDRFQIQIDFIERYPETVLLGSAYNIMDTNIKVAVYSDMEELKCRCILYNNFPHPTVFIKRSFLVDNNLKYDSKYFPAEDYKLWVDIILQGGIVSNINLPLLDYRRHEGQISSSQALVQRQSSVAVRNYYLSRLNLSARLTLFEDIVDRKRIKPTDYILIRKEYQKLYIGNLKIQFFELSILRDIIDEQLIKIQNALISQFKLRSLLSLFWAICIDFVVCQDVRLVKLLVKKYLKVIK
jgi:glycosyltransferase involved in cell wall biosynthesis